MITGENIESAERALAKVYAISYDGTTSIILDRVRVDKEAFENFMHHHSTVLFKRYLPDIDPRHEPSIRTMLLHFFAVGAIAQRKANSQ